MENEVVKVVNAVPGGWWGIIPTALTMVWGFSRLVVRDIVRQETAGMSKRIGELSESLAALRNELKVRFEKKD